MTTNTVEQAVPEVTVRDFLTQHALRVNCAARAPCKVGRNYTYCITFVRSFLPSFLPFFLPSLLPSLLPSFLPTFFCLFVRSSVLSDAFVWFDGTLFSITIFEPRVKFPLKLLKHCMLTWKALCRLSQPNNAMDFHPNDVTAMSSSKFFSSTYIRAIHFTIKLYSTLIMLFIRVSAAGMTWRELIKIRYDL